MSLELHNLRLLRGRTIVLDNFSATLARGQGAWLLGPNGSGKSSLLRAIAGLLPPLAGTVNCDGAVVLVARGGDTPLQTPFENLCFWARLQNIFLSATAAEDILKQAGLAAQAHQPTATLSAGQQQRLALARLLAKPFDLWLLDEPASALDAAGQAWLNSLLKTQINRGGMVVCATHQPETSLDFVRWSLGVAS